MSSHTYSWVGSYREEGLVAPRHLLAALLVLLALLPLALFAVGRGAETNCLVLQGYRDEASGLVLRVQNECRRRIEVRSILFETDGRLVQKHLGVYLDPHEGITVKLGVSTGAPGSLMVIYSCGGATRTAVLKITG